MKTPVTPFIVGLKIVIPVLSILLFAGSLSAQQNNRRNSNQPSQSQSPNTRLPGGAPESYDVKSYTGSNGSTIRYSLLVPEVLVPGEKYPLVLCLHGSRGATYAAEALAAPELRKKHPCFVMAPAAPRTKFWSLGGIPDHVTPEQLKERGMDKLDSVEVELMEALEDLVANHAVDPDRLYITGQSKGGHGTWGTILKNPDRFAAAAPICGPVGTVDVTSIAHLPIWIFHGNADPTVDVEISRRMADALRKVGASPGYTEFPGVGHSSWVPAYGMDVFWDWLFEQSRPGSPES